VWRYTKKWSLCVWVGYFQPSTTCKDFSLLVCGSITVFTVFLFIVAWPLQVWRAGFIDDALPLVRFGAAASLLTGKDIDKLTDILFANSKNNP
jgi:hypothetical protein